MPTRIRQNRPADRSCAGHAVALSVLTGSMPAIGFLHTADAHVAPSIETPSGLRALGASCTRGDSRLARRCDTLGLVADMYKA